jgi:hypothetical protein
MIRLSSVFWVLLASTTALATFAVKYEVQSLDDRLGDARKATAAENRERRVLDAEWAYLNRPDMLAQMNERFLSLAPITRKQLQTAITDLPMRPAPPAPPVATAPPVPDAATVATVALPPAENAVPEAQASLDRPARPEKLAMASAPVRPLLVKAAVPLSSSRTASLDSRSLDQLIARIAASR